jgi:predicted nucleic acid-binding protein
MLERDERLFEIKHFPESLGMHLRSNVEGAPASTKLWTDAWLAALAEASGMTMVTFDRGFRKFSLSSLELLRI